MIGCDDAWRLAEFYAYLLGWTVVERSNEGSGGWALVRWSTGEHKLEREEPFVLPVWPAVADEQQGMHLDIAVDGLAPMSAMEQRREQFGEVVKRAVYAQRSRRRPPAPAGAGGRLVRSRWPPLLPVPWRLTNSVRRRQSLPSRSRHRTPGIGTSLALGNSRECPGRVVSPDGGKQRRTRCSTPRRGRRCAAP